MSVEAKSVKPKRVPESEWEWFGLPGHFVGGMDCRFHMLTKIGGYLVSSVGAYFPDGSRAESDEPKWIGHGRKYETYVFKVGEMCDCGCGQPMINQEDCGEVYALGSNNAVSAQGNHMKACELVACGSPEIESWKVRKWQRS